MGSIVATRFRSQRMLSDRPPSSSSYTSHLEQLLYRHEHRQGFNRLNSQPVSRPTGLGSRRMVWEGFERFSRKTSRRTGVDHNTPETVPYTGSCSVRQIGLLLFFTSRLNPRVDSTDHPSIQPKSSHRSILYLVFSPIDQVWWWSIEVDRPEGLDPLIPSLQDHPRCVRPTDQASPPALRRVRSNRSGRTFRSNTHSWLNWCISRQVESKRSQPSRFEISTSKTGL